MKAYFKELAQYNLWANQKISAWCHQISEEQWKMPLVSSFNSLAETVLHILGAEDVWYQRMKKVENPVWLPFEFKGSKESMLDLWLATSQQLIDFTNDIEADQLNEMLDYKRINGEAFSQPYREVLAHVFNHSTYHRGQIITLLRQLGFNDVSSTDLLLYYRK